MKIVYPLISASLLIGSVAGILGGTKVKKGENEYVAIVHDTPNNELNDYTCGGVLISNQYVLTTTSCTEGVSALFVTLGATRIGGRDGVTIEVTEVLISDTNVGEFALLKLEKTTTVAAVNLPTLVEEDYLNDGNIVTVLGRGITSSPPKGKISDGLLKLNQTVITNEQCYQVVKDYVKVDDFMSCGGGVKDQSACVGDTGGPVIHERKKEDGGDVLVGVITGGLDCGVVGSPTIYARLHKALEWLLPIVEPAAK